ncbi:MAG TPA: hypothetical protein ENI62_03835 [Gammaproteobacteria bacterium]|nr:hypothetical protein [Gammaproteobacteria bacterium]
MTADAQQQTGEVNILHRGVGAFVLITLVLVLLKGLLREQRVPAASVKDFAAAVVLPIPDGDYRSTVQLDQSRQVLNSIRVPVKIGGNINQTDSKPVTTKPVARSKPLPGVVAKTGKNKSGADKGRPRPNNKTSVKIPQRKVLSASTRKGLKTTVKLAKARSSRRFVPGKAVVPNPVSGKGTKKSKLVKKKVPSRLVVKAGKRVVKRAGWIVQIGLYSSSSNAKWVEKDLRRRGYPVASMPMKTGKGALTRLWIGPYQKRSTAARIKNKIIAISRYKHSFIASNPLLRK